ncbi:MAG TPA: response regulator [Methylomirabilota bacterium]|jgi:DNA-binding NtrC family response regulator|nr:response regulator [Methylomirabilota bacterium]
MTGGTGGLWALIADGDERAARRVAARLGRLGFWAYPTTRGDEALWLAATYPLTLAVIDTRLDDMAGPELVTRLRRADPRLPVVVTTGDGLAESEVRARRAGIVHFAPKPLDLRRLEAIVIQTLTGRGRPAYSTAAPGSPDDE